MKKTLPSLLLLAVLPAAAFAEVTLYGRANVSLDLLDDGADYSEFNVSSNSSRIGFKGSEEFENVTAIYQIEQEIDFRDSGTTWASRDTYVGLKSNLGMVRIGKFDTPFKTARGPANLFSDQLGDMRNVTRVGDARFDERTPNTVHYQTPDINGLQFNIAYSLHEGTHAADDTKDQAISVSTTYKKGALDLAGAYESFAEDSSRGKRDAFRIAAGYSFADLKLVGFYQSASHDNEIHESDVIGVGAEYALTQSTVLRAHVFTRDAELENMDSTLWAVGIEHRLAKPLRVYANYAQLANDDAIALTPWRQGRTTDVPGTMGETASGLSAGLRFDF
jgi:predicted porin